MKLLLGLHNLAFFNVCLSLQVLQMEAPAFVKAGQDVEMTCEYDLEGENLYSIKWFLGLTEIYSYIPHLSGAGVTTVSREMTGVNITNTTMGETHTRLVFSNLSTSSSGYYQCQVSGDGPRFLSDSDTKQVTVAEVPSSPPSLSGLPADFSPGHFLSLNCSLGDTSTPIRLSWILNGETVTDTDLLRHYRYPGGKTGLQTYRLGLQFWVQKSYFHSGKLEVACRGELAGVYNMTSPSHVVGRFTEPLQFLETRSFSERLRPPWGVFLLLLLKIC